MTNDEVYIANAIGSCKVGMLVLMEEQSSQMCGPPKPEAVSTMAYFGDSRVAVHVEPLPLRLNWKERAIAHFLHERERA